MRHSDFIITLNTLALSLLTGIEIFRPGFVTGAVNLGWVWLGTVILVAAALGFTRAEQLPANSPNQDSTNR